LAKSLEKEYSGIHTRLLNLGEVLNIEAVYLDESGKTKEVESIYKVGRFEEKEKKEVLMKDLEKK
jgi:hypothetical protein